MSAEWTPEAVAELTHQLQCAKDEELAAIVKHIRDAASSFERLAMKPDVVRALRMMAEALLIGVHRRESKPGEPGRVDAIVRIMKAGGFEGH